MSPNPRRPGPGPGRYPVLFGLACCLASFPLLVHGQRVVEGKGLKFGGGYYDPPFERQLKSLLECAKALPQPGGRFILVSDARMETFRQNGQTEMIVEAPECMYDQVDRTITSPGPLRVRTGDGQFRLEGEGFLWQQTNSSLQVSNKVHTTVRAALANGQRAVRTNAAPAPEDTVDIYSDRFSYALESGQGIYRGNVRVAGTNLALTGGTLTVDVPRENRHLEKLVATEDVVVDYLADRIKTQAKGQQVTYDADKDILHISGNPTWRADLREGRGDELLLDRKSGVFESAGNAWLRMPSQGGGGGFLPHAGAKTSSAVPASTNQWVEIFSDRYVIQTNSAVFTENVRVADLRDNKVQGKMSCGILTASFSGTNELQTLVAQTNVVIESETNRFAASRAVYSGTNGMLELIGSPSWKSGPRDGWGDFILVNVPKNEMNVFTNAVMRLPANELKMTSLAGSLNAQKVAPAPGTNQLAVISCDEYVVGPELGQFRRNVRIEHPQMKLASDLITATMPSTGEKLPRIVADRSVIFDLIDDRGKTLHGVGDQAVYTYQASPAATNEMMELTGNPAVVTASTNMVGRNKVIVLNLTRHTVLAPGRYNITGVVPPSRDKESGLPTDVFKR